MKRKRRKSSSHPNGRTQERPHSKKWFVLGTLAVVGLALLAFVFSRTNRSAGETTAWVEPLPTAEAAAAPNPPIPMRPTPPVRNPSAPSSQAPAARSTQSPVGTPAAANSANVPAATSPPFDPLAKIRRIKAADLRAAMERGEVLVIDVRDADSYATSHIEGSTHIPLAKVQSAVSSLPRDKMIVTYCT